MAWAVPENQQEFLEGLPRPWRSGEVIVMEIKPRLKEIPLKMAVGTSGE